MTDFEPEMELTFVYVVKRGCKRMVTNEEMHHYMDTHSPYLLQLSYMYVKDWSSAEDIVQEVFIQFFKTFDQYEQRASVKTYLTKMTIHKCYDYLRSFASRKKTLMKLIAQKQPVSYEFQNPVGQSEMMQSVLNLPMKYREMIILYYYEELTTSEIAMLLSLSDNTVKTRLRRAREKLKIHITNEDWRELLHE